MAEIWYRAYPNNFDAEKEIEPVTVYKETPAYVYLDKNLKRREARITSYYCYYKTKKLALEAIAERVATHRASNRKNLRDYETEIREQTLKMFNKEHEFNKHLVRIRRELAKA